MNKKTLINLGKPIVLLNGLVTDKNNYTYEQKIQLLKEKSNPKFKSLKNPKIIEHSSFIENNNNIMKLSEDEEDENEVKVISKFDSIISKNKEKNLKINKEIIEDNSKNDSIKKEEANIISKSVNKEMFQVNQINLADNKKRPRENKKNKTQNRRELQKSQSQKKEEENNNNNLIVSNSSEIASLSNSNKIDIGPKNESLKKSRKKKQFITENKEEKPEIKVEYKEVPKANSYEEIIKIGKNNSCVYITLFDQNDLKNIIEEKSQTFMLNKRLKKEKKENAIISNKNNEIDLTKELLYLLKNNNKIELFKKLCPEYNNILQYMPINYTGINNYGYLNINYCSNNLNNNNNNKNEDEIHFITNYFHDKNNSYILQFRKYILNLSCFKSNETFQNDRDYNIYHIIIPKKSVNKINININSENSLESLISKLNCEYYSYCQLPGELLIVEPESILLSYYSKEKTGIIPFFEKNYLINFWNKMNKDSFSDYLILQNICKNGKYKDFPIVNTLIKLVNEQSAILSNDIIKIILEIYNDFENYENINKYICNINDNNIRFHKLYLNGIYLCQHCQQEIFNFYVYDTRHKNISLNYNNHCDKNMIIEREKENNNNFENIMENNEGEFICINCAYEKKFYEVEKNIIFFKYSKEDLNNFFLAITSKINSSKNREKKEIISDNFRKERKDDCINVDEFLLKIDGPLRILDKEFKKNKNDLLNKEILVDKCLNKLGKKDNDNNNINKIDPLNPSNFRNDIKDKDIYEKLDLNDDYQMDIAAYSLIEQKINSSNHKNKNNMNINFIPFNNGDNVFNFSDDINNKDKEVKNGLIENSKIKEKEKNNHSNIGKGTKKNKKKNSSNLADLIFSGDF